MFFAASALLIGVIIIFRNCCLNIMPTSNELEADEIAGLEKENSKLKEILKRIVPGNKRVICEDQYRNLYLNAKGYTPASFKTYPLQEVLKKGMVTKFNVLSNKPYYLRPIFDPSWKGAYFRGWLYLPDKNIDARHRLFIYPFGGSSIYDFTGTLAIDAGAAVNYHRNINFLIYGFDVKSIKWYENQVLLVGEPLRTGFQVISVVQDDLLPGDLNTKDILVQLCTPDGYEIDFIYGNVIKYEYLKKQIEENTVKSAYSSVSEYTNLELLLNENLSLKKELSYFVPLEDKEITQEKCRPVPSEFPFEIPDIKTIRLKGKEINFNMNYRNDNYERPVYDPLWLENYRKRWCFLPKQICYNRHRLFLIPENKEEQPDFFGVLSFHESYKPVKFNEYGFLLNNSHISKVVIYNDQILLIGTPSRTGAEIITIIKSDLSQNQTYLIRLVTPDDLEVDNIILDD